MPTARTNTVKEKQQLALFELETPDMPELDRSRTTVREITSETAANMVREYHYAHAVPSITVAYGMYVDNILAGCITYGVTANRNLESICGKEHEHHVLELNRLFIHDWAGRNSESYLIGESIKLMKREHPDFYILVSYADSAHGHRGVVYQATNWIYTGESTMHIEGWMHEGKRYHPRSLSSMFGSCATDVVLQNLPGAEPIFGEAKYRYVYLLGGKKLHKELVAALKFPPLPYPKILAESRLDENGQVKDKPKTTKPKSQKSPAGASSGYVTPCCLLAAPLDCPHCFAIDCQKHGVAHAKTCPNYQKGASEVEGTKPEPNNN